MDRILENAINLEQSGDYVAALKLYRDAYVQNNAQESAILGIAQCALALDNVELAFEFFVKLLILNHDHPWGYLGRANVLFRYAQHDRALSDLARAISLDSPASDMRIDCAALLNAYGYCDMAYEVLVPVRQLLFEDDDFKCEWGFALLALNRLDHDDLAVILRDFADNDCDDPFRSLCQIAFDYKMGRSGALGNLVNLLNDAPDLIQSAEYLGLPITLDEVG